MRFIDSPLKSQRKRQLRSLWASFWFVAELLSARIWQLRLCNLELSALFATILGFIPVSLVNISLGYPLSFFRVREALERERKEHRDIVMQELYLREKEKRSITPWTLSFRTIFLQISGKPPSCSVYDQRWLCPAVYSSFHLVHTRYYLIYYCFVFYSLNKLMQVAHDFCFLLFCYFIFVTLFYSAYKFIWVY